MYNSQCLSSSCFLLYLLNLHLINCPLQEMSLRLRQMDFLVSVLLLCPSVSQNTVAVENQYYFGKKCQQFIQTVWPNWGIQWNAVQDSNKILALFPQGVLQEILLKYKGHYPGRFSKWAHGCLETGQMK